VPSEVKNLPLALVWLGKMLLRAVVVLAKSDRLLARYTYVVSAPVAVTPKLDLAVAVFATSDKLLAGFSGV